MRSIILPILLIILILSNCGFSQTTGSILGQVTDEGTGEALPFVNIILQGTAYGAASDSNGNYKIANIAEGTYTLISSLVGYRTKEIKGLAIYPNTNIKQNIQLRTENVEMSEVVVYGASKKNERITDAPAAVSVLEAAEIQLNSGSGQMPKLLETQPGIDIAQSGINDFNVNTRGFNSSLNRRLVVLLDGRDLAIAFLGAQEWNGLSVPVEDLGRVELIRGPSSALYGANAFNGVINIQSPSPKEIRGTKMTIAGGELNTFRGDIRHAGISGPWGYKINFGKFEGNTWSVTRKNLNFEYGGFTLLNNEEVDLKKGPVSSTYGSCRIDYDWGNDATSTVEAGMTQVENEVFVTGIGRVQVPKALKPWGRISYSNKSIFAQIWTAGRDSKEPQVSLSSGLPLAEHSLISQAEVQYRNYLLNESLFLIAGTSFKYQTINTDGTLMQHKRADNFSGLYSQLEYSVSQQVKAVVAARWDRSTLHDNQISPKIAVVWSPLHDHSFRATFNQAFQAPNLSELFLYVLRTATNPYTNLKSYFAYHGYDKLKVEKITGYELGYKGIINNTFFITVDGYYNFLHDFITDLAPGVHPNYPEPTILPGDTVLRAIWSYSNAGSVQEAGCEIGVNYYLSDTWILDGNYAYFDFRIVEKAEKDILLPNAPRHKLNGGIMYKNPKGYTVEVAIKYIPSFDWAAGIYSGKIPSYTLVNLMANYQITQHVTTGLNVSNLFNQQHYEIFGGSLIRRRALANLTITF